MGQLVYPLLIEPLSVEDGGGFLASVPDLPGSMSDAGTPEMAVAAVRGAIEEWIEEARRLGREVPLPTKRVA
jgi:predicted RNase H-like HicB family nuclease